MSSGTASVNPVMFPPGRERLATRPVPTASPTPVITMGMVVVARLAARAEEVPILQITQARPQGCHAFLVGGVRVRTQQPDPVDLPWSLRLRGERRS